MDTCVIGTVCAPTSADGSSAKCVEEFSQGVIHLFYYHALLISSPVRSSLLLFSNTHQGSGAFCSVDIMCGEGLTVCFSCFSAPLEYLFQSFIFFSSDIFSSVTMKIHRRLLRAQRWHQAHSRAAICQLPFQMYRAMLEKYHFNNIETFPPLFLCFYDSQKTCECNANNGKRVCISSSSIYDTPSGLKNLNQVCMEMILTLYFFFRVYIF